MTFLLWVLVIIALVWCWINKSGINRCDEDIDEIRASLFDLRTSAKANRAEINKKLAELKVMILKNHDAIPENRIPYHITSDCIACGTCLPECPVDAIDEGDIFEIKPETCIACNKCADVCPVHACKPLEIAD